MPGIDETKEFVPLKIAVLTVSDTRSLEEDRSGATLAERIGQAGHAVAAMRKEPDRIAERTQPTAEDRGNTHVRQAAPRQCIQIGQPLAVPQWLECRARRRVVGGETIEYIGADLEPLRSNRRAQPRHELVGRYVERRHGLLQHPRAQTSPASMCARHTRSRAIAEEDRQAVRDLDGADDSWDTRKRAVGN
jgi:hypothetical protein